MLNKLLGRRVFGRGALAAPLVLGEAKRIDRYDGKSAPIPWPSPPENWVSKETIMEPPGLKTFYDTSSKYRDSKNYLRAVTGASGRNFNMDLNISALRSVSRQHKCHMNVKKIIEREKEEMTFFESLKDSLGLREWFKNRNTIGAEAAQQERDWG